VTNGTAIPEFSEGELALADTLILIMKVMSMHGIIDHQAIDTVFSDLESRYRGQELNVAAAMAEYLRVHTLDQAQGSASKRPGTAADRPEGSC